MHAHNVFYTHWHIDRQMAVQLVQISVIFPFIKIRGRKTKIMKEKKCFELVEDSYHVVVPTLLI